MPGQHKHHPFRVRLPEDDRNWVLKHVEATGKAINAVIAAAVREYRDRHDTAGDQETATTGQEAK